MRLTTFVAVLLGIGEVGRASGQGAPDTTRKPPRLDTIVAASRISDLVGIAQSANQGAIGAIDLRLPPTLRPGEAGA